jgi:hypothetical protein
MGICFSQVQILKSNKYLDRVSAFTDALNIAQAVIKDYLPQDAMKDQLIEFYTRLKQMANHPERGFKNVKSLSYLESAFFEYWNSNIGFHIDKFWEKISASGLQFQRQDIFKKIWQRKRIANIHEYDFVIDNMVMAQQENKITQEQADLLNVYIAAFEKRAIRKK